MLDAVERERLAHEAQNLATNEIFTGAIGFIRAEALEKLAVADPADADAIRELQATVRVVDGIRQHIRAVILNGQPRPAVGIA